MKNNFIRNCFSLLLSLLFHSLIFTLLFADMSIFPVQSAPQEQPKLLAEVVLLPVPAKQAEGSAIQEEKPAIQEEKPAVQVEKPAVQNSDPEKTPEVVKMEMPKKEEIVKTELPKKNIVKKQTQPVKKAAPKKNTPEKKVQAKQEQVDKTSSENNVLANAASAKTTSANTTSDMAAKGVVRQTQGASSIIGIDSVSVINRVKPAYPHLSRKRAEEGNVVLLANVKNGKVVNVTIEKSSGISALDSSALTAIKKWSFSQNTNVTVRIPVSFKLKE